MSDLIVEHLTVRYQTQSGLVPALSDVSFTLTSGKAMGLWGQSGCGKSTVMRALLGLPIREPGWVAGEAWYGEHRIAPPAERFVRLHRDGTVTKRSVPFDRDHRQLIRPYLKTSWRAVFQEPIYSFEPGRPLGAQICEVLDHYAGGIAGIRQVLQTELAEILDYLELPLKSLSARHNLELSGGECQRVSLALALVGSPMLLLADEPTTAIDARTRGKVTALLRRKIQDLGMSVLIASHNQEELADLVDDVVVLCKGRVVERLPRQCLGNGNRDNCHPYTQHLWFALGDQDVLPPEARQASPNGEHCGCPYSDQCSDPATNAALARICVLKPPPMVELEAGHLVSCWLHVSPCERRVELP